MTADLELALRGLWRNPAPCRHRTISTWQNILTCVQFFKCLECGCLAARSELDDAEGKPALEWGRA